VGLDPRGGHRRHGRRRARLAEAGYEVSLAVRFGDPAQELADLVDEEDVDAVVIATHGRSGLSRAVLGSVAERLLRMVVVPVVMVRPHDVGTDPAPLAPFGCSRDARPTRRSPADGGASSWSQWSDSN
jgi:hypothetical protein